MVACKRPAAALADSWSLVHKPEADDQRPSKRVIGKQPPTTCKEPLPVGPEMLEAFTLRLLGRLSVQQRQALQVWCRGRRWSLGSILCSGTDSPVHSAHAVCSAVNKFFHFTGELVVKVQQAFSCERSKAKQDFLRLAYPAMPLLFSDALALAHPYANEVISGGTMAVPDCDALIAGFPCWDMSPLSPLYSKMELEENGRTTAEFVNAIKVWMQMHPRCPIIILENGVGFADGPNLRDAVEALASIGVVTKAFLLNPLLFGIPQRRPRLWLIGVRRALLQSHGLTEDDFYKRVKETIHLCLRHPMNSVEDFMLPPHHPAVLRHTMAMGTLPEKHPPHESLSDRWFPGLRALSTREWSTLRARGLDELPENHPRVLDTTQMPARADFSGEGAGGPIACITPRGTFFHTGQVRPVLGTEALRFQGMIFDDNLLLNFPEKLLRHLAGNSFECHCYIVMQLAAWLFLSSLCSSEGESAAQATQSACSGCLGSFPQPTKAATGSGGRSV